MEKPRDVKYRWDLKWLIIMMRIRNISERKK